MLSPVKYYQKEEGFRIGIDEYYEKERQQLLHSGSTSDLALYRTKCRKFPLQYADSWIGDYGGIGWDVIAIDKRLAYLDIHKELLPRKGNFIGTPEDGVFFQDDPNGKFFVSMVLEVREANRKQLATVYEPVIS